MGFGLGARGGGWGGLFRALSKIFVFAFEVCGLFVVSF